MMSLFKNSISFSAFIEKLKSGTDDVLKDLNLNEERFTAVPYSTILENPEDIAIGVNKVKIKNWLSIFKIFDTALVKYFDDGQITFIFHTITTRSSAILQISQTLFDKLGMGLYDSDRHFSFIEEERVIELAKGTHLENRAIVNVWQTEKYNIVLQYEVQPFRQFAMFVTRKVEKEINRNSRRKTIIDLLTVDLSKILLQEEISEETILRENGDFNCIDYTFALAQRQLKVFDTITIRLFSKERVFTTQAQTHITFTCSQRPDLRSMLDVCNAVIKVYGSDAGGSNGLEIHEIDHLEQDEFWTGRTWYLNEKHGLYDSEKSEEEHVYDVTISNGFDEKGFTLFIWCYNNLIEYFTANE